MSSKRERYFGFIKLRFSFIPTSVWAVIVFIHSEFFAWAIGFYEMPGFSWEQFLISNILSPFQNPHGAWVALIGLMVSIVMVLCQILTSCHARELRYRGVHFVSKFVFTLGALCVFFLSINAVLSDGGFDFWHVLLAYLAYMGLIFGLSLKSLYHFLLGFRKVKSLVYAFAQCCFFCLLLYLYLVSDVLLEQIQVLVILEWGLCIIICSHLIFASIIDNEMSQNGILPKTL